MIDFKFFNNPKHITLTRYNLITSARSLPIEHIKLADFDRDSYNKFIQADYVEYIDGDKKIILKNRYGNEGIQIL
jgi:hypothetical protein